MICSLKLCFRIAALVPLFGVVCQGQQDRSSQELPVTYSDNANGLAHFLGDLMRAAESKDTPKELMLINSLMMPRDSTWFSDKFGPAYGPRLLTLYKTAEPALVDEIKSLFEVDVQHGLRVPKVLEYADPANTNAPMDSYLNCMNEISPLYQAAFNGDRPAGQFSPDPNRLGKMRQVAGDPMGYYVYVSGNFRFVPGFVFAILPEQRPLRIQLDMNVMKSKVSHRVPWSYPPEILRQHIKGKLVVHLILDTTGRVKKVGSVEGPSVLADLIVPTLKQWTFDPTTLDGDPVEVDLAFEVNFQ